MPFKINFAAISIEKLLELATAANLASTPPGYIQQTFELGYLHPAVSIPPIPGLAIADDTSEWVLGNRYVMLAENILANASTIHQNKKLHKMVFEKALQHYLNNLNSELTREGLSKDLTNFDLAAVKALLALGWRNSFEKIMAVAIQAENYQLALICRNIYIKLAEYRAAQERLKTLSWGDPVEQQKYENDEIERRKQINQFYLALIYKGLGYYHHAAKICDSIKKHIDNETRISKDTTLRYPTTISAYETIDIVVDIYISAGRQSDAIAFLEYQENKYGENNATDEVFAGGGHSNLDIKNWVHFEIILRLIQLHAGNQEKISALQNKLELRVKEILAKVSTKTPIEYLILRMLTAAREPYNNTEAISFLEKFPGNCQEILAESSKNEADLNRKIQNFELFTSKLMILSGHNVSALITLLPSHKLLYKFEYSNPFDRDIPIKSILELKFKLIANILESYADVASIPRLLAEIEEHMSLTEDELCFIAQAYKSNNNEPAARFCLELAMDPKYNAKGLAQYWLGRYADNETDRIRYFNIANNLGFLPAKAELILFHAQQAKHDDVIQALKLTREFPRLIPPNETQYWDLSKITDLQDMYNSDQPTVLIVGLAYAVARNVYLKSALTKYQWLFNQGDDKFKALVLQELEITKHIQPAREPLSYNDDYSSPHPQFPEMNVLNPKYTGLISISTGNFGSGYDLPFNRPSDQLPITEHAAQMKIVLLESTGQVTAMEREIAEILGSSNTDLQAKAGACFKLGLLHEQNKNYVQAIETYEKFCSFIGTDAKLCTRAYDIDFFDLASINNFIGLFYLGKYYASKNNSQMASECYSKAILLFIDIYSENPLTPSSEVWNQSALANHEKSFGNLLAVQLQELAKTGDIIAIDALAQVYRKFDLDQEARQLYINAALDPINNTVAMQRLIILSGTDAAEALKWEWRSLMHGCADSTVHIVQALTDNLSAAAFKQFEQAVGVCSITKELLLDPVVILYPDLVVSPPLSLVQPGEQDGLWTALTSTTFSLHPYSSLDGGISSDEQLRRRNDYLGVNYERTALTSYISSVSNAQQSNNGMLNMFARGAVGYFDDVHTNIRTNLGLYNLDLGSCLVSNKNLLGLIEFIIFSKPKNINEYPGFFDPNTGLPFKLPYLTKEGATVEFGDPAAWTPNRPLLNLLRKFQFDYGKVYLANALKLQRAEKHQEALGYFLKAYAYSAPTLVSAPWILANPEIAQAAENAIWTYMQPLHQFLGSSTNFQGLADKIQLCLRHKLGEKFNHLYFYLKCSITGQMAFDPVLVANGQLYESYAIVSWFKQGKMSDPNTNELLERTTTVYSEAISNLIPYLLLGGDLESYPGFYNTNMRRWIVPHVDQNGATIEGAVLQECELHGLVKNFAFERIMHGILGPSVSSSYSVTARLS